MKKMVIILSLSSLLLASNGEKIFTKNGCYGCHGIDAQGNGSFPKLAGKSKYYLISRLKGYKNGTIKSNRANMMKPFAKSLSDKDIEDVATYLSKLKSSTNKDSFDEEYDLTEPN